MDKLVEVKTIKGNQVVNARDLHSFLITEAKGGQKGEMFSHWIERCIDYCGLELNVDYTIIEYDYNGVEISKSDNQNVRVHKRDYVLTLESAKQISMIQKNDKGKVARQYFIECEKKLARPKELSRKEMALMVIAQEEELERLSLVNQELQQKEEYHAPMVDAYHVFMDSGNNLTVEQAAKSLGIKSNIALFARLRNFGCIVNKNQPSSYMIEKGYMITKITSIKNGSELYNQIFITPKGLEYIAKKLGLIIKSNEGLDL